MRNLTIALVWDIEKALGMPPVSSPDFNMQHPHVAVQSQAYNPTTCRAIKPGQFAPKQKPVTPSPGMAVLPPVNPAAHNLPAIAPASVEDLEAGNDAAQHAVGDAMRDRYVTLWFDKALVGPDARQAISSAGTSINQIPAGHKLIPWEDLKAEHGEAEHRNSDVGGGKHDTATHYLAGRGVRNFVTDPYNRSHAHNAAVVAHLTDHPAHTGTCHNVLNTIAEPEVRHTVIHNTGQLVRPGGRLFFSVYHGDGTHGPTSRGWQEARHTRTYLPEVQAVYPDAHMKGRMIVATNHKGARGLRRMGKSPVLQW